LRLRLRHPVQLAAFLQRAKAIAEGVGGRNFALAAIIAVIVVTGWIAWSTHGPVSHLEPSTLPAPSTVDAQAQSQAAAQPTPVAGKIVRPRIRRVRLGNDEIDYIGDDVTVRYFHKTPLVQRKATPEVGVAYLGDDVTVRYYQVNSPAKPGSR
jgi:hypothetical protein